MKILNAEQIKSVDQFTIEHEPINSINLMERAAKACCQRIIKLVKRDDKILIVCGKGNNGGDGLAICRLLLQNDFDAEALVIHYTEAFSEESMHNYNLLKDNFSASVSDIHHADELKEKFSQDNFILIDALFGTGLNRSMEGLSADVIHLMNQSTKTIISIDVPSGLFIDQSSASQSSIVQSTLTLTFEVPKLAFLMPQNSSYVPEFEILDIGLNQQGIQLQNSNFFYITKHLISSLLKKRAKFSHKGTYGHALLLAGSKGKSGAALIASKACLKSGAGLLTLHSSEETLNALLIALPEAMSSKDSQADFISEIIQPENYGAIGMGPGIGLHDETQQVLKKLLQYYSGKLILDADALNILAENKTWLNFLPANCILTPHPKEFERLTEKHADDFDRLKALQLFSLKYKCIVILKGAHSAVAMPDGNVFFNSSGNAGLAKGGSGDGLTGIILGLLARGYNVPQAALIGTFIHGFAADLLLKKNSMESILISDVIDKLPVAFKKLEKNN